MKLTKANRETLYKLYLLSGENISKLKSLFSNFLIQILINYLGKNPIQIPYVGSMEIENLGTSDYSITIDPSDYFKSVLKDLDNGNIDKIQEIVLGEVSKNLEEVIS